jgi:hypothetical protein
MAVKAGIPGNLREMRAFSMLTWAGVYINPILLNSASYRKPPMVGLTGSISRK